MKLFNLKALRAIFVLFALLLFVCSACAKSAKPEPGNIIEPKPSASPKKITVSPASAGQGQMLENDDRPTKKTLWLSEEPFVVDLDQDGSDETITIEKSELEEDDLNPFTLVITKSSGVSFAEKLDGATLLSLAVGNFNSADDLLEILVCVDSMSADYMTTCFQYDGTQLMNKSYIEACLESEEDHVLAMTQRMDVLGTWYGETTYELNQDFEFVHLEDIWHAPQDFAPIVLTQELPVEMLNNDTYAASSLPVGTALVVTATDNDSVIYFKTGEGLEGKIFCTMNDWGAADIERTEASLWFKEIRYAD